MVIRMSFPFGHSVSCIKEENTGVSLVISSLCCTFATENGGQMTTLLSGVYT